MGLLAGIVLLLGCSQAVAGPKCDAYYDGVVDGWCNSFTEWEVCTPLPIAVFCFESDHTTVSAAYHKGYDRGAKLGYDRY